MNRGQPRDSAAVQDGHVQLDDRSHLESLRSSLGAYFVVAYALSWAWMLSLVLTGRVVEIGRGWPTHFPALLGPVCAAFLITGWTQGGAGIRDLLTRMFRWRVGVDNWLWAFAGPLVFLSIGLFVVRGSQGAFPAFADFGRFNGLPELGVPGAWAMLAVVNGFGEETGWRGFAIPALQRRFSPLCASLILAPLWALWHLPFFFVLATFRDFGPAETIIGFLVGISCGSIVLTWLYNRSGGSILMVTLWHATFNLATGTAAAKGTIAAVVSTLVILQALILVALDIRAGLRKKPSTIGPARPF